jgi:hypothetical protein
VNLDGNRIMGPLPSEIKAWECLHTLSVSRCKLTGPIPEELFELKALQRVMLTDNALTGT